MFALWAQKTIFIPSIPVNALAIKTQTGLNAGLQLTVSCKNMKVLLVIAAITCSEKQFSLAGISEYRPHAPSSVSASLSPSTASLYIPHFLLQPKCNNAKLPELSVLIVNCTLISEVVHFFFFRIYCHFWHCLWCQLKLLLKVQGWTKTLSHLYP